MSDEPGHAVEFLVRRFVLSPESLSWYLRHKVLLYDSVLHTGVWRATLLRSVIPYPVQSSGVPCTYYSVRARTKRLFGKIRSPLALTRSSTRSLRSNMAPAIGSSSTETSAPSRIASKRLPKLESSPRLLLTSVP